MKWKIIHRDMPELAWNADDGVWVAKVTGKQTTYLDWEKDRIINSAFPIHAVHHGKWQHIPQRHKDAVEVQNAVNPSGIALAMHQACKECYEEGLGTTQTCADPAVRLFAYKLADLTGSGDMPFLEYEKCIRACEALF
jgi:hypothetical protein